MGFLDSSEGIASILDPADYSGIQSGSIADAAYKQATQLGIDEQRRQFDITQANLAPYLEAAYRALSQQRALTGQSGRGAQQYAIDQVRAGPGYQQQLETGQEQILADAAASGQLRGGNVRTSLADFGQSALSQAIAERYNELGAISGQGPGIGLGLGNLGGGAATSIQQALSGLGEQGILSAQRQTQAKQDTASSAIGLIGLFCDARLKENVKDLSPEQCKERLESKESMNFQSFIMCLIGLMQYRNKKGVCYAV